MLPVWDCDLPIVHPGLFFPFLGRMALLVESSHVILRALSP